MKSRTCVDAFVGLAIIWILLVPEGSYSAPPDAIRVGATVSTTGKYATEVGPFQRLPFENWVAAVNYRGGTYLKQYGRKLPLRLAMYDDRSDAATARRFYERLITVDRVNLFFGPYKIAPKLRFEGN